MHTRRALAIIGKMREYYPEAETVGVPFDDPFQALILTILSAQTTDRQVAGISEALFRRYPSPRDLAEAKAEDVEEIVRSTGFYHVKSRNIIAAARTIQNDFHGEVPRTFNDLLTIPGVGRKTANIVLSHAFGIHAGIAVDTHVFRISRRIGFSDGKNAERVEKDLTAQVPPDHWGEINTLFIIHGRKTCTARNPSCSICPVRAYCRYYRTVQTRKDR